MTTIVLRSIKGIPLTNAEVDANFSNLNADKIETTDAVSTDTANKVVKRDASGNFSAGIITATFSGNLTGNVTGNLTGNASTASTAGSATTAITAQSATTAITANNIAGGSAGTIPYQSATGTTAMLASGTAGQFLMSNGASAPIWSTINFGVAAENDITTNASYYPSLFTTSSGFQTSAKVSSTKLYFNPNSGTLNATAFNSLSDLNQKNNVVKIENATATLKQIDGVEFDWIGNGKHSAGVVAQKLETILPFLVDTNADGVKSVNYSGLIAYLIESNKELSARVAKLENNK